MKQRLRLSLAAWRHLLEKRNCRQEATSRLAHLAYTLSAITTSSLMRIQEASQDDALKHVVVLPPVFILGFWRSGTTFLHELISRDPGIGYPSTYACLNPAHFLLSESWIRAQGLRKAKRPMDDLRYSWISPQEDEFALLCMDAPSPYQALIFPSLLRDPPGLLDFSRLSVDAQQRWRTAIVSFLRLLTIQQHKPMVLKSPPHGFKFAELLSLFPSARFIVIERNPYEVFASNLKLWETLTGLYGLEPGKSSEIEDFVLQAYLLHEKAVAMGTAVADRRNFARVRFEDLLTSTVEQVERLYHELHLDGFSEVQPRIADYLRGVKGHRRNRFQITARQKARIDELWGYLIEEKGYSWQSASISLG